MRAGRTHGLLAHGVQAEHAGRQLVGPYFGDLKGRDGTQSHQRSELISSTNTFFTQRTNNVRGRERPIRSIDSFSSSLQQ